MAPREKNVVWALVLLLAVHVASPQETQMHGFGKKSGAAVPSFAVSGAGTIVTVHGLNFSPGGERV